MRYNGDGSVAPVVRNRIPSEVVMVVGGWCTNGPTALVETFNPRNHRWVRSPQLNNLSRAYHSLSFVDGKMIIAGGMDGRAFFNTANSLDLNTMVRYLFRKGKFLRRNGRRCLRCRSDAAISAV